MLTRREAIHRAAHTALAVATAQVAEGRSSGASTVTGTPTFCFFSKHLPALSWAALGRTVKAGGFDGVDLTVRTKGHVLPEHAARDLPRAVEAIRAEGLAVPMITTELTSAGAPAARPLLEAAAASGVRYFKPGYWLYRGGDVREEVASTQRAIEGLAALAAACGIEMGVHNHAGYIGGALWEIAPALDRVDPRWAGYYFDPRHAVAEGGGGAWKAATRLVLPRLKMLAIKDCRWIKAPDGWLLENCPLGEGLVDWTWFGSMVRDAAFGGPISIHLEYDIPSSPLSHTERTMEAARRELAFARRYLVIPQSG